MIRVRIGPIGRIPAGEGREFEVEGRTFAVFRARGGGAVHVTQARCPHREGRLADGLLGDGIVVCPMHGYRFDVATGAAIGAGNECPALRTYPASVDERGDLVVEVCEKPTPEG
jgi:nitrite reductase (NADH) small subunit